MKVLVAEDNSLSRIAIRTFLKVFDVEVFEANDGDEAIKLWDKEKPDIVITDLEMPKLGGIELIEYIRNSNSNSYSYIMVITAHGEQESFQASFEKGADDFLVKPFRETELHYRIKAAIRLLGLQENQSILYALVNIIEFRDGGTDSGHPNNVGKLSKMIAKNLKSHPKYYELLNNDYIDRLFLASALHDIGKIGTPDEILKKPGPLSYREFAIMKNHTINGSKVLEDLEKMYPKIEILRMAKHIARSHHERVDGGGYPDQLTSDEIPLCAKIVAVADAFDAMTQNRVYKVAMTMEDAINQIKSQKGMMFDADVVDAFLMIEQDELEKLKCYE